MQRCNDDCFDSRLDAEARRRSSIVGTNKAAPFRKAYLDADGASRSGWSVIGGGSGKLDRQQCIFAGFQLIYRRERDSARASSGLGASASRGLAREDSVSH